MNLNGAVKNTFDPLNRNDTIPMSFDMMYYDSVWLYTWVVAALRERPSREHRPSPAATDRAINSTPASPTAPWDLAQSHLSMVKQA